MNMVIDAGNSLTKIGIFEKDRLHRKEEFTSPEEVKKFLHAFPVQHLILGSVTRVQEEILLFAKVSGTQMILTHNLPIPITNTYATPETLGVDRLAAACGAWLHYPREASLVIDAGTCINYEFINANGEYIGGAISPGVNMRFQSMHQLTARLPSISPRQGVSLVGNSTASCLQSGVMNGVLEEINGISARYRKDHPGIRVILTGGDAHFFEILMKPPIFVAPDLVLQGLNSILSHNVNS